jgi:hypothetical protein
MIIQGFDRSGRRWERGLKKIIGVFTGGNITAWVGKGGSRGMRAMRDSVVIDDSQNVSHLGSDNFLGSIPWLISCAGFDMKFNDVCSWIIRLDVEFPSQNRRSRFTD